MLRRRSRLVGGGHEPPVVPEPFLVIRMQAGDSAGKVTQSPRDVAAPMADCMLGGPQLQGWERQDVHGKAGGYTDADVDCPVGEVVQWLVTAEQQHEQSGERYLRALVSQPPPAAHKHPGQDYERYPGDRRA